MSQESPGNASLIDKFDGYHHVLLEGCTFPPEKQGPMAQSLGPMTVFIKLLRTDGKYREKWAAAVKRRMGHIDCIDIITLNKGGNRISEMVPITSLLAEILLITTARQATKMTFPLCAVSEIYYMMKKEERSCWLT